MRANVWDRVHEYHFTSSGELSLFFAKLVSVNSISWAPGEYGLILAVGASNGEITIIERSSSDKWELVNIEGH